jgi:hypothetical protein
MHSKDEPRVNKLGRDRAVGALQAAQSASAKGPAGPAAPDLAFAHRLSRAGFAVDEIEARAGHGARHIIWVAMDKVGAGGKAPKSAKRQLV